MHIGAFVRALGPALGGLTLCVPAEGEGEDELAPAGLWPGVRVRRLPARGDNLLERVIDFRRALLDGWGARKRVVHVRSIWEGYPIARRKRALCERFVYEVNGLPSIELKYHHAAVAEDRELLAKLRHQEQVCLQAADRVLTPSAVTARHLLRRGVPAARLRVIQNGVDPETFAWRAPRAWGNEGPTLLYAGTLAPWQGLHVGLEAFARWRRERPGRLIVAGPVRGRQRADLERRMRRLRIEGEVEYEAPVAQLDLAALYHRAHVALAPLPPNDRNVNQGCSPLKVIEAMAAGTPVLASNLAVVRELARRDVEATLVRAGSARSLVHGLLRLEEQPEQREQRARAARVRVERRLNWRRAQRELLAVYAELGLCSSSKSAAMRARSDAGE